LSNKVINKKREATSEEEEFFLAENRHDEITSALGKLAAAISQPKNDKAIIDAINKQGNSIDRVAAAISNQPNPEVNVQVSNQEIIPLLKEIKEGNMAIKAALENKLYVDSFKVVNTGQYGSEKTINVNYKPMNQITIKK